MKSKIILTNWTQREDTAGGCETSYAYLHNVFPNSELVSGKKLQKEMGGNYIIACSDKYLLNEYKKDPNILVIRDAEFGNILDISKINQILIFANPFNAIKNIYEKMNDNTMKYNPIVLSEFRINKGKIKVAVSNFMVEEMKKRGFKSDYVIPNCVDTNIFKPMNKEILRKKYNIPNDKRVGIWVGNQTLVKNFGTLMDTMYNSDVFWIFITKNYFKKPINDCAVFLNMSQEHMVELYNCADFFLLTSPIESCGISSMEAMSCNIPCILSKAGYFWDFWDDRIGIQVNWDNLEEHLNAIERINEIETNPMQVIFDQKLDFESWKNKWKEVVNETKNYYISANLSNCA